MLEKDRKSCRKPTQKEKELIAKLIDLSSYPAASDWEEKMLVCSLKDEGMGSLELFPRGVIKKNRKFGVEISTLKLTDLDGVEVTVALYLDKEFELYQLDVWKVDFTKTLFLK
ncbi:hypothetical protein Dip510_001869 [Elusimicrobium posterum]|uniref:DUF6984 family protein n=1 Tax=Elusimicrobium posterum TaxID=3116653 RepID=UPI003C7918BE